MTEQVELQQPTPRSNTTLWILVGAFVLPMIVAYAYFFLADDYQLGNHGDLLQPVIQIESLQMTDSNGKPISRDELVHHWKMFMVSGSDCKENCQQSLYYMRQINIALGKNADRFKHMIIHTSPMSSEFNRLMTTEYGETVQAYATLDRLERILPGLVDPEGMNAIFIMDPLGNIMMRFPSGTDPKLILKDLNRLLKISRIG